MVFTNDRVPRAVNPDGSPKSTDDWELGQTMVGAGASLGAGTVVVTGGRVGTWAMTGSGTIVTEDVEDHALVVGSPGRRIAWVSAAGDRYPTQAEARTASVRERAELVDGISIDPPDPTASGGSTA